MKIEDALKRFLVQLEANGRSANTTMQYRRHVRRFAEWLVNAGRPQDVGVLAHEDVAAFLSTPLATARPDGKPKKAASVNAVRSSLRVFLTYVHQAGYASQDSGRLIRRARCGPPPPRALSDDQQERLLAALDAAEGLPAERDRVLIRLLLGTGVRLSSALGLDVEDVDLERGEVLLRRVKGGRIETIYLSADLVARLRAFLCDRDAGPVFVGPTGRRLGRRQAQRRLGAWFEAAGIKAGSPHVLRHSFATGLYRRTRDVLLVKEALGHRSIGSTLVYARAGAGRVREAMGWRPCALES